MNRVAAVALNIVAGRGVCGAAVEVDPGPRRTQQVMNCMGRICSKYRSLPACTMHMHGNICHAVSNHFY